MDRDEWMRRTGPLYPALVALRLLTRAPVLRGVELTDDDTGRAAVWFTVVGALVGAALALIALIVLAVDLVPAIVAALVLALAMVVTGALHEGQLARAADLLGRDDDRSGFEGRLGLYGLLAVVILFAMRWILLLGIDRDAWPGALIAGQVAVRWVPLFLLRIGDRVEEPEPGRSLLIGPFSWAGFGIASGVAVIAALGFGGAAGLVSLLLCAGVAFVVGLFFERRYGGLSTATLGAASMVCELTVFACFAIAAPAVTSAWAV